MSADKLFHLQLETGLMCKLPRGYWYMVCLIRPQDYIRPGKMPLECQMVWRINLLSFQKPCKWIHWTNNNICFQSSPSKYWQNTYFDNWRRGKLWYAIWRCSIVFHCFSFLFTLIHRKNTFFSHIWYQYCWLYEEFDQKLIYVNTQRWVCDLISFSKENLMSGSMMDVGRNYFLDYIN